jgi:hypothetical protein
VTSTNSAINYVKAQLGYQNNSDISAEDITQHNDYIVELRSISLAAQGHTGIIGKYMVDADGHIKTFNKIVANLF